MPRIAPPVLRAGAMLLATALVATVGALTPRPIASAADAAPYDLRVGSFNVRSITKDHLQQGEPWRVRRPAVVRDILGERVDVLGVQELSQNANYADQMDDGPNQMEDLVAGLNKNGARYALTNSTVANCVRAWTLSKCVYQYRGASRETRIIYNQDTLDLLSEGSYEYLAQSGLPNDSPFPRLRLVPGACHRPAVLLRHHAPGQQLECAPERRDRGADRQGGRAAR